MEPLGDRVLVKPAEESEVFSSSIDNRDVYSESVWAYEV